MEGGGEEKGTYLHVDVCEGVSFTGLCRYRGRRCCSVSVSSSEEIGIFQ